MSDAFPPPAPSPAPGAKAAKVCGILALVFALSCVGIPVALVLGIVALVQHGKAKRLARAQPGTYEAVPATGLVTGIIGLVLPVVMLPFAGIVGAIAVPALLSQRERAREVAVRANLEAIRARVEASVASRQAQAPGRPVPLEEVFEDLLADPELAALKNPLDPQGPAFRRGMEGAPGIVMLSEARETEAGVTTWSIQLRAVVRRGGQEQVVEGAVVTRTVEEVHGRTEDGWEVVTPPAEPAPQG